MTNASEKRAPLGTLRALLSILLAIAVLVAAQTLALLLGEILLGAGVPGPACNVLTAVLVQQPPHAQHIITGPCERRRNKIYILFNAKNNILTVFFAHIRKVQMNTRHIDALVIRHRPSVDNFADNILRVHTNYAQLN